MISTSATQETPIPSSHHDGRSVASQKHRVEHDCCQKFKLLNRLFASLVTILLINTVTKNAHCFFYQNHHHHSAGETNKPSHNTGPCPQNWFQLEQKCFRLVFNVRNYGVAKSRCSDFVSHLAHIEDEVPREDEVPPTAHNSTIVAFLTNTDKPEYQSKMFYVNISSELYRQYENSTFTGADLPEHMDLDSTYSDSLWLPKDDPGFQALRFNITGKSMDPSPAFVLAYSQHHKRWGLVPISPSKKAAYICERSISNAQREHQHIVNHSGQSNSPDHSSRHHTRHHHRQDESKPNEETNSQASSESQPGITSVTAPVAADIRREVVTGPQQHETPSALFRDFPQNQAIVLGSTSEMRCSPIDNDSIAVWTFNGRNLTQSNRVRVHPNGTLRIEHVRNSDGGNYTCTITSGSLIESKSARLEILEKPHPPDYISAELIDKLSTSVRIQWTPGFTGNSPITKYLVEMRTVATDNIEGEMTTIVQSKGWELAKANISADQTSVIIPDLKPAKKYIFRIKAVNRVGTGDPSFPTRNPIEVPVQPPSMAPENLTGVPRSSTSISIQWSPPPLDSQNGAIKGYKIRHKLAGYNSDTDWYSNDIVEAAHLNYVLEDLIVWQNYEIQIAAENDKGVGPFSPSIFIKTKEGKPDRPPRSVTAESLSSTMMKVNWNPPPPQHINGNNQGYRVQVWSDKAQTQLIKEITTTHNSLTPLQTTTIDGLSPYTDYYVTVKCMTGAGDGVPNEDSVNVKTRQDLPEAVQTLEFAEVLDKSLKVVWTPPRHINGELNHYTLEYFEASSNERKTTKKYPASTTEAKISDLTPETPYTFKVWAHTDIGAGPVRTNSTTTSVPPVFPEPPSNLVPSNIGPFSATIQFDPGFNGNSIIEKWIAEAFDLSHGDRPRWQNIYVSTDHTNGNNVVIRNLRPYTRYQLRLIPVNIVGPSRYASSPTPEFMTSQTEPEQPPRDLTIEEVKSNSAIARWSPLNKNYWHGQPRGYNLTWSDQSTSFISSHFINDTRADSYQVKNLEEYTEYTFRIFAVNDAGLSPSSETVTITTLEDVPSSGPTNLTAHALSSSTVSVDWSSIPKKHRNGVIKGFKVQYQALKPDAPLQHKTIEDNSTKHVTLNDLKPFTLYHLAVAAFTSAGDGVYTSVINVQTLEDTPGNPQNLSSPTISQNSVRILWDPPGDPNGDILGYKVTYHTLTENNKDVVSQELHQNERTFKANNLKPDTHYVFTVTAKTKEGWGQQSSMLLYTHDSELRANLPFFKESWFVILCACSSVVMTVLVTALLYIQTRSRKYRRDAIKSASQDRLGEAGFTIDDEANGHYNNGFGLLTNNGAHHRRSNGTLSQSTANFTLPKTPPRPHPGVVVHSDEGDDDVFEDIVERPVKSVAGTSRSNNHSSSDSSIAEKPSEISSSPAPDSESAEDEYVNMANKHFVNHYANVNNTLNGGRIIVDNMAGSRAPLAFD